jgi:hypothetical protein
MMDRSLYPEGVEVHQRDLERTETTKAFHIIQRHGDNAEYGVVTGAVTVNTTDGTTVDVSSVSGYAPNGEYIDASTTQGLELADYTLGAVNFVVCIYRENDVNPQPHETLNEVFPTSAVRDSELKILTETEYNNLPVSDDNLANDSYDRALVIAKVVARGIGVNLTSGDITNPTTFTSAITISTTGSITGTDIINIDNTTNTGNGTLTFTFSTKEFTWQAPGDTAPGAPVSVLVSGTYVVSSGSGKTLTLQVIVSNLPGSNQTDTITITNVYSQSVSRHTATDFHHRSLIGSGIPSIRNPHGLTLEDLSGSSGSIEAHQDLFHSNGILRISSASVLATTVNTVTVPDQLTITPPTGTDLFYLNGIKHEQLSNPSVVFTDVVADAQAVFDIYVVEGTGGTASLEKRERFRYATTPPPLLSTVVQIIDISRGVAATGSARIFFDDSEDELSFDSGTGTFGPPVRIPTTSASTLRLYDENQQHYVDVYSDALSNWGGVTGSDITETLTVFALPTDIELEERLRISAVVYSGSTGFLGYGFGSANSPNTVLDRRYFGVTGLEDLRGDVGVWEAFPETSPKTMVAQGHVGVSNTATWKAPIRAIHIHADNGYAEQVWEAGSMPVNDLGRTWRWGTDPSGYFKAIRSRSGLRNPTTSLALSNTGKVGINILPTGSATLIVSGLNNTDGIASAALGTGNGITAAGGNVGGAGGVFTANAGNDPGVSGFGHGSGAGCIAVGGDSDGPGGYFQGGVTNGVGIRVLGTGTGHGAYVTASSGGHGVFANITGNGNAIRGEANGNQPAIWGKNNSSYGVYGESAVVGVYGKGLGAGPGGEFDGGGTSGEGIIAHAGGGGIAVSADGHIETQAASNQIRSDNYRWHDADSRDMWTWISNSMAAFYCTHRYVSPTGNYFSEVDDTGSRWSGALANNFITVPFIWPQWTEIVTWEVYVGAPPGNAVKARIYYRNWNSTTLNTLSAELTTATGAGSVTLSETPTTPFTRSDGRFYFIRLWNDPAVNISNFYGARILFRFGEPPLEEWSL